MRGEIEIWWKQAKRMESIDGKIKKFSASHALMLSLALAFSLLLIPLASAQVQYGWCSRTIAGKTCQPDVADYECESGFSLSRPSDCYEVYCIDPSGVCMANVPYRTCIEEINGIPAT
ncbi:MAG: hypothetical protein QXE64_02340, partial [Candidatus Pacearchaeota archaeon]